MPKSLVKTRKHIAKKRNGAVDALHQNSRDSKRLHRAQVRDERLEKLAAARRKQEQPLLDRAEYFRQAVQENGGKPLQSDEIQAHVKKFVHQYDDDYEAARKTRRPGRPASSKEDMLKMKIEALGREYKDGFLMPDLSSADNVASLGRWEGSWSYLSTVAWVRLSESGSLRKTSFPPTGDH